MSKYVMTSPTFQGSLEFEYDEKGILSNYKNLAVLNEKQLLFFIKNFPIKESVLPLCKGETGKITRINDITFMAFWKPYPNKKERAVVEKYWNSKAMTDSDRAKAIRRTPIFIAECYRLNTSIVYPIRYLRNRRFEDGE